MAYHQPFEISAFHSCDRAVGLRILNGDDDLIASENEWDWLGPGIYFWEQNPGRALEYAVECAAGQQKNKTKIKTPFVIGAIIELENCLNLLEPGSIDMVKKPMAGLQNLVKKMANQCQLTKVPLENLTAQLLNVYIYPRKIKDYPLMIQFEVRLMRAVKFIRIQIFTIACILKYELGTLN